MLTRSIRIGLSALSINSIYFSGRPGIAGGRQYPRPFLDCDLFPFSTAMVRRSCSKLRCVDAHAYSALVHAVVTANKVAYLSL
jgi:hypothetical protein